ncbi:MAG TPA: hypothetical protein VH370_01770 [Humisphaera sp.]|jgi:hypothetical protein|nr:hypothetical protein [Humisphaera sp.]
MTSQDTFEQSFRKHLLDLLYGQWATLGAPFSERTTSEEAEVIDPEALIWCSLEFLPTEPRLSEAVVEWLRINPHYLVRQRILKERNRREPRTLLWQALDKRIGKAEPDFVLPSEPLHGLSSPAEVVEFSHRIGEKQSRQRREPARLGRLRKGSATLLLEARDLLGHDIRHFLLVYLLANPHGARLREIQAWSGHAYRSLADAADRWQAADVVTLESGYCRLTAIEPFQQLLHIKSSKIVLVNWWTVFEIGIRLLRDLAKARQRGFDEQSAVTKSLKREAAEKLRESGSKTDRAISSSVRYLLACFSGQESDLAAHVI